MAGKKYVEACAVFGTSVINDHMLAEAFERATGKPGIYISYHPEDRGRGGRGAYWAVVRPGHRTDADGHWLDHGAKTFRVSGSAMREDALESAKAWASARYGIPGWAKTPRTVFAGSWFRSEIIDWVEAKIRDSGVVAPATPKLRTYRLVTFDSEIARALEMPPHLYQLSVIGRYPSRVAFARAALSARLAFGSEASTTKAANEIGGRSGLEPETLYAQPLNSYGDDTLRPVSELRAQASSVDRPTLTGEP